MAFEKLRQDALTPQQMLYRSHGFKPPNRNMTPLDNRPKPLDISREISTRGSVLKEPRQNTFISTVKENIAMPRSKTSMHNRNQKFNYDII